MPVSLRKSFHPRRRVTLLEPLSSGGGQAFTEHDSHAEIEYRSGNIKLTANGTLEQSNEAVLVTIPRHGRIVEGWRIRDERNAREYRVTFRQPVGYRRTITRLHCTFMQGIVSPILLGIRYVFWSPDRTAGDSDLAGAAGVRRNELTVPATSVPGYLCFAVPAGDGFPRSLRYVVGNVFGRNQILSFPEQAGFVQDPGGDDYRAGVSRREHVADVGGERFRLEFS